MPHTPGPWRQSRKGPQVYGPTEPGWKHGKLVASCGAATGRPLATQHANARLIAAAPELLAACDDALRTLNNYSTEPIPVGVYNRLARLLGDAIHDAEEEAYE